MLVSLLVLIIPSSVFKLILSSGICRLVFSGASWTFLALQTPFLKTNSFFYEFTSPISSLHLSEWRPLCSRLPKQKAWVIWVLSVESSWTLIQLSKCWFFYWAYLWICPCSLTSEQTLDLLPCILLFSLTEYLSSYSACKTPLLLAE